MNTVCPGTGITIALELGPVFRTAPTVIVTGNGCPGFAPLIVTSPRAAARVALMVSATTGPLESSSMKLGRSINREIVFIGFENYEYYSIRTFRLTLVFFYGKFCNQRRNSELNFYVSNFLHLRGGASALPPKSSINELLVRKCPSPPRWANSGRHLGSAINPQPVRIQAQRVPSPSGRTWCRVTPSSGGQALGKVEVCPATGL